MSQAQLGFPILYLPNLLIINGTVMRMAFNRIRCHRRILLPAKGFPSKDSRSHGCVYCHGRRAPGSRATRPPAGVLPRPSSLLGLSPALPHLEDPVTPLPFPTQRRCPVRPSRAWCCHSSITRANWSHWTRPGQAGSGLAPSLERARDPQRACSS